MRTTLQKGNDHITYLLKSPTSPAAATICFAVGLWLYCQGWCALLCRCQQTAVASNLVAGVKYGQKMYIFLCKPTWLSPFVSKHKVEQEADDTEDDPHCCQKVEDYYQPKLKGVNDFLWSAIRGYPVCSNTNYFLLLHEHTH